MAQYTPVRLTADLSRLTDRERSMIPLLIDAAVAMDEIFWQQAYGDRGSSSSTTSRTRQPRRFAEINYGPWDRLDGNEPFIPGVGRKSEGAELYPQDMTKAEFERGGQRVAGARPTPSAASTRSCGATRTGALAAVPYHVAFRRHTSAPPRKLREAAALADDAGLKRYLELRAEALLTDEYQPSDLAWMDMKNNAIDVVIGPIETYEDELFGYKTAHEAFVLIKDQEWSERLARYAALLPALQRGLPVPDGVQARDAPAPTPTSTPTTSSTTPGDAQRRAPRRSRSTCPTTSRCSSRRARAGSSSRTRCAPSSTGSSCRSPTS